MKCRSSRTRVITRLCPSPPIRGVLVRLGGPVDGPGGTGVDSTKIALVTGGALSTVRPLGNNVRPLGIAPLDDFLNTPLAGRA